MMEYRNAKRTATAAINCEINHPVYGWIPFTAVANDTGAQFDVAALYSQMNTNPSTQAYTPPAAPEPTTADVDRERDRRIALGFTFAGKRYQSRAQDLENIAGAATAALGAMVGGAQAGNLRWHGGATDFAWIAEDNSLTTMDAQTMFTFAQVAMAWKQAHLFNARALKDIPIQPNFAADVNWP